MISLPLFPKNKITSLNNLKLFLIRFNMTGRGLKALATIMSELKFFSLKISFCKTSTFKLNLLVTSFKKFFRKV